MQLLEDLRSEHELIEQVVGSLQGFAAAVAAGARDPDAAADYIQFFRLYAGRYHHAREEDVLFPALVSELGVPAERGPIAALTADHRAIEAELAAIEPLLGVRAGADAASGGTDLSELVARVRRHGTALLHHIDAENHVLFAECAERFARASVLELPARAPDAEEEAARRAGLALVRRFPPQPIPDLFRGEGCVACPAYGERCAGIEREWWSDGEWEDFFERNE